MPRVLAVRHDGALRDLDDLAAPRCPAAALERLHRLVAERRVVHRELLTFGDVATCEAVQGVRRDEDDVGVARVVNGPPRRVVVLPDSVHVLIITEGPRVLREDNLVGVRPRRVDVRLRHDRHRPALVGEYYGVLADVARGDDVVALARLVRNFEERLLLGVALEGGLDETVAVVLVARGGVQLQDPVGAGLEPRRVEDAAVGVDLEEIHLVRAAVDADVGAPETDAVQDVLEGELADTLHFVVRGVGLGHGLPLHAVVVDPLEVEVLELLTLGEVHLHGHEGADAVGGLDGQNRRLVADDELLDERAVVRRDELRRHGVELVEVEALAGLGEPDRAVALRVLHNEGVAQLRRAAPELLLRYGAGHEVVLRHLDVVVIRDHLHLHLRRVIAGRRRAGEGHVEGFECTHNVLACAVLIGRTVAQIEVDVVLARRDKRPQLDERRGLVDPHGLERVRGGLGVRVVVPGRALVVVDVLEVGGLREGGGQHADADLLRCCCCSRTVRHIILSK
eukprot:PhM_4_TR3357/c0_g1_i1/m.87494